MMEHKATGKFTDDEKNWMDTLAVNFIIAQSDGFQQGYAQAIRDFKENIIDYWQGSDDKPQQSVLDTLVDLGVELKKRQQTVEENIETAKERGYEQYYGWQYKDKDEPFEHYVDLFTKKPQGQEGEE